MSLFKQFAMDSKKERDGVLITYGANADGSLPGFRVVRMHSSNQNYRKAMARETAPYQRQIQLGTLDNAVSEHLMRKVFCQTVLVGWEHVFDEQDTPIPFNFDNAMQLFARLPELYSDLYTQANGIALFRQDSIESETKNS